MAVAVSVEEASAVGEAEVSAEVAPQVAGEKAIIFKYRRY